MFSFLGWEVEIEEDVVEDGDLVVVWSGAVADCFVEVLEIVVGFWRIVFGSYGGVC